MAGLAYLRRFYRISQARVAEAVGAHSLAVSQWENGRREPPASTLVKLCEFFDCEPKALYMGVDELLHRWRSYAQDLERCLPEATWIPMRESFCKEMGMLDHEPRFRVKANFDPAKCRELTYEEGFERDVP